jgi:hypothetical protein
MIHTSLFSQRCNIHINQKRKRNFYINFYIKFILTIITSYDKIKMTKIKTITYYDRKENIFKLRKWLTNRKRNFVLNNSLFNLHTFACFDKIYTTRLPDFKTQLDK